MQHYTEYNFQFLMLHLKRCVSKKCRSRVMYDPNLRNLQSLRHIWHCHLGSYQY